MLTSQWDPVNGRGRLVFPACEGGRRARLRAGRNQAGIGSNSALGYVFRIMPDQHTEVGGSDQRGAVAEAGERGRAARVTQLSLFSGTAGGMLGVLAFATIPYSFRAPTLPTPIPVFLGLPFSLLIGASVGICCSPAVVFLLASRDVRSAKATILWPSAVIVVLLTMVLGDRIFELIPLCVLAFVLAALIARWLMPRVWDTRGLCFRCGYDLRESYQFGRCPECGRSTGGIPGTEPSVRGLSWPLGFVRRWPALPVLLLTGALLSMSAFHGWRGAMRRHLVLSAASEAVAQESVFDLAEAAVFDWDTVCVHRPHSNRSEIEQALGIKWSDVEREAGGIDPSEQLFIFVRSQRVAEVLRLAGWSRDPSLKTVSGFSPTCCARAIRREEAIFRVETSEDGWRVFVLAKSPTAECIPSP